MAWVFYDDCALTLHLHRIVSRWVRGSTHVDGEVLGLGQTDAHNLVEVWVDSPVGTSDHIVIYINVAL